MNASDDYGKFQILLARHGHLQRFFFNSNQTLLREEHPIAELGCSYMNDMHLARNSLPRKVLKSHE